ncbi:cadmium-translocating P-type ATPase [Candidatus Saccharibacteria bacterium]|nr:cadmium-translocating P-type ATPase [Candidatus Saccharibacteria bacterium]
MLKKIKAFVSNYKQLAVVLLVFVAGLVLDLSGRDRFAHLLLGVSSIIVTIPLAWGMIQTLRSGMFGVDLLAITAIVTSVILGEYWAGMVIVLMLTGGEALEDYAEGRAKVELTSLMERKPTKAHVIKSGKTVDVKASSIRVGDKVVILPGEVVPVDGEIIEGSSSFDESSLTGESLPVDRKIGDKTLSGSINNEGRIVLKATSSAEDSQYQQIIKLVKSAASSQSPFVRLADRYSIPFTLISFMIAGTAWILSGDPVRFLEVIVVATPCPLLLGAPIALVSGMSRSAKFGIIIKNGSALEKLAEVNTIAFDKTGTLTIGKPSVDKVNAFGKTSKEELLSVAAGVAQNSTHILSSSIVESASSKKIKFAKAKQVNEVPGQGLKAKIGGKNVLVGRLSMLEENGVNIPKNISVKLVGQTATYISQNNEFLGYITFMDHVREDSKGMLRRLKSLGIKHTLMVTGDNEATAKQIAKQVGIEKVEANCLPADKIHAIERVENKPVAFVGDGVNDAPVLTSADVGIALGARGSTVASESADVVIMLDDISRVATSYGIAKKTFQIARQAIMIGIFISIGLMLIFSTGKFKAVQGAAIQELVDITVIIYALRAHGSKKSNKMLLA